MASRRLWYIVRPHVGNAGMLGCDAGGRGKVQNCDDVYIQLLIHKAV